MAHLILYLAVSFAAGALATVLGFFGLTVVAGGASVRPPDRGNKRAHAKGAAPSARVDGLGP
jgi:hypothetical protein